MGYLEGSEGHPPGSEGQQEGSEGQPKGSGGHRVGVEGQPGRTDLLMYTVHCTDIQNFSLLYRTLSLPGAAAQKRIYVTVTIMGDVFEI